MNRYVCIHGHFYQPPRENPWLESIEQQDSAFPYHDWNERITDECYRPNMRARMLDGEGRIAQVVNNYARISFNFGPTVLSWFEEHAPDVYEGILRADKESAERFGGHGSALAQAYNHMILPLANDRDRRTQIRWGVRDFEHRFGRRPEGMWLPETAVNTATLENLVDEGIRFTVLAPRQGGRSRAVGAPDWEGEPGAIDPSRAYEIPLPSGRSIAAFFYDGPISQGVAFEKLLESGEGFAHRLMEGFDDARQWPQLVHIATDGESYGHHHRHGEMALAHALDYLESRGLAKLTNYGQFLELHPPAWEGEIVDNSSWSCVHGVERWKSGCGCHSGMHGKWHQNWRAPLREALDWLRDRLAPEFEREAGALLKDPWEARDDYIAVVLDRDPDSVNRFFAGHAQGAPEGEARVRALKLLELQRNAMLMYTSCGWFFDELSGIETVQVIQYAGRVVQLSAEALGLEVEEDFLGRLRKAPSNLAHWGDGKKVYEEAVKPAFVDLTRAAEHYAASSMFQEYAEATGIYCFDARREDLKAWTVGRTRLQLGRINLRSRIVGDSETLTYAVLHLGDHQLSGGVRRYQGQEAYAELAHRAEESLNRGDLAELMRVLDTAVGMSHFSLRSLFRDEQRRVVRVILQSTLSEAESGYRQLYDRYAALLRFLGNLRIPAPRPLAIAGEFVLNGDLRDALAAEEVDVPRVRTLIAEARRDQIRLDEGPLTFAIDRSLGRMARRVADSPRDLALLERTHDLAAALADLPFEPDLEELQFAVVGIRDSMRSQMCSDSGTGLEEAKRWVQVFDALCDQVKVRVQ